MKNNKYIFSILIALIYISACEKNSLRSSEFSLGEGKAFTKFYFLSPGTPSVMIKANGVKVNGANTSGSLGVFPSTASFPDYAALPPNASIQMSLPNTGTSNDSVVIFSGLQNTEAGKFYSTTLADTGIDRTLFTIEDKTGDLTDSGYYFVRFVNAVAKSPNISIIRVDSMNATTVFRDTIIKDISFKSASNFVRVPMSATPTSNFYRYRMIITSTGKSFGTLMTPTQSTAINQRYATIYGSGFVNGTGSLAPVLLPLILNR